MQLRKDRAGVPQCIDVQYEKWNKFENFVKFASKKEIRE
jgi:hypothetical protein